MNNNRPAHIMKATRILQAKVGRGNIKKENIQKSQDIIDSSDVDFVPLAQAEITALAKALEDARAMDNIKDFPKDRIIRPVMQLKANAGMFKFPLITDLTAVLLDFLEILNALDEDVLDIVEANMQTVKAIIDDRFTGNGGAHGEEIIHELTAVCHRYVTKDDKAENINIPTGATLAFLPA